MFGTVVVKRPFGSRFLALARSTVSGPNLAEGFDTPAVSGLGVRSLGFLGLGASSAIEVGLGSAGFLFFA